MSEPTTATEGTRWLRLLDATERHNLVEVRAALDEDRSWVYTECQCGETFRENWEFTDHIRRLVWDALETGCPKCGHDLRAHTTVTNDGCMVEECPCEEAGIGQ